MKTASLRLIVFFTLAVSFAALALGIGGEFEGTYQVGRTTCTVKPIKMAFEIRWAKGKGSMVFFYESGSRFGDHAYVSEEKPDGFDRFVFSDERLASGVFIRSDGVRYPVKKKDRNR